MLRTLLIAGLAMTAAPAAFAADCDVNAESAAVVAAWGAKVKDGSLPQEQLAEISAKIQEVPTVDEETACGILAELKMKLGLSS